MHRQHTSCKKAFSLIYTNRIIGKSHSPSQHNGREEDAKIDLFSSLVEIKYTCKYVQLNFAIKQIGINLFTSSPTHLTVLFICYSDCKSFAIITIILMKEFIKANAQELNDFPTNLSCRGLLHNILLRILVREEVYHHSQSCVSHSVRSV